MNNRDDKLPPDISPPAGQKKKPRRRASDRGLEPDAAPEAEASIDHDEQGNAVWKLHVKSPRRRKDDTDVDPLDVLDVDSLSLEEEDEDDGKGKPFTPYDKSR